MFGKKDSVSRWCGGGDLTTKTLDVYLEDSSFVDYFNTFLLQPIFPNKLVYNEESQHFEQITEPGENQLLFGVLCDSTTSMSTMHLSDEYVGDAMDREQCSLWVLEHRLPLFLKSDLFSEFKLWKFLTCSNVCGDTVVEIGGGARGRQRSHSVPDCLPVSGIKSGQKSTKREMNLFRKFLQGTAGEKYWLFWLDAERMNYSTSSEEVISMRRNLEKKYLMTGGALKLPVDTKLRFNMAEVDYSAVAGIRELQQVLAENLKNYWYPRFILHKTIHSTNKQRRPRTSLGISHAPHVHTPFLSSNTPNYCHRMRDSSRQDIYHGAQSSKKINHESLIDRQISTNRYEAVKSRALFQRHDTSLPQLLEGDSNGQSVVQSQSRDNASRLPKSLRQTYTPSHPSLASQHIGSPPPTGSNAYHKLTSYTHRHLPNPTSSREYSDGQIPGIHIQSVSGTPVLPPSNSHVSKTSYMVECLASEYRNAGGYFEKYLKSLSNKVPLNCLYFWREVQEYKSLFIGPSFKPTTVDKKAKVLYSQYIVESCPFSLSLSPFLPRHILSALYPPYDDIFDEVEEHVLQILFNEWKIMKTKETEKYQMVDTTSLSRGCSAAINQPVSNKLDEFVMDDTFSRTTTPKFSTPFPYLLPSPHPEMMTPFVGSPHLVTTTSPTPAVAIGLRDIVHDPNELQFFKMFLNKHKAAQHLMCWMEIEAFRGIPSKDRHLRDLKARQMREKYFNRRYLLGPNSPAGREAQAQIVSAGGSKRLPPRPKTSVFREAQKHVQAKLEKKWVVEFLKTPEYMSRNTTDEGEEENEEGSFKPRITANPDLKFSQSHEALLLRKALQDESSQHLFLSFLSVNVTSGSNCKTDVQFWLEVQKFKAMCNTHTDKRILSEKLKAMKECYLTSSVPPKLHIDIPQSMANARTFWQDYQLMSHNMSSHIDILAKIQQMKVDMENMRMKTEGKEKERKKDQFLFETTRERDERLKQEQQQREIGEVAVSFKLAHNHPHS